MQAKCKICGVPLDLDIDPDYLELGDVHKLIPMATCNRCGDMRYKRESYHDDFYRRCLALIVMGSSKKNDEKREQYKIGLVILARKYSKLMSQFSKSSLIVPVDDLVSKIMENPKRWSDELRAFRRQVRAAIREDRARNPALPYND